MLICIGAGIRDYLIHYTLYIIHYMLPTDTQYVFSAKKIYIKNHKSFAHSHIIRIFAAKTNTRYFHTNMQTCPVLNKLTLYLSV